MIRPPPISTLFPYTTLFRSVLLVDNDPQGDLTKVMRSDPKSLKYTLANLMNAVLDDTEPELFVNRAVIEGAGIHYIPANSKLAGVSSRLVALQMSSRYRGGETGGTPCELVMARVLELFQSQYDYILIDCGHSMDLLTINALAAAHQAIVPVQAHYLAKVPLLLLIPVDMHQGLRRLPPLSLAHHRAEQAYGLLHQRIGNAGQGRVETRPDLIQHGDLFSEGDKLPRALNTALIDLSIPPQDKVHCFRRGLGLKKKKKSALICTGISLFLHTD